MKKQKARRTWYYVSSGFVYFGKPCTDILSAKVQLNQAQSKFPLEQWKLISITA